MLYIIVPVYNCDSYMTDSIIKLKEQNGFSDVQFVFVDDYSTDDTSKIIEYETRSDSNCKIIQNKYAKGIGSARNTGLSYINGISQDDSDLVGFCDSDDVIEIEAILRLAKHMDKYSCDLGVGLYDSINFSNGVVIKAGKGIYSKADGIISVADLQLSSIFSLTNASVWNKLFRLSKLKEHCIRFPDCNYAEDMAFLYKFLSVVDSVYLYKRSIYSYAHPSTNPNSSDKKSLYRWKELFTSLEDVRSYISNLGYSDEKEILLLQSLLNSALGHLRYALSKVGDESKKLEVQRYIYYNFIDKLQYQIEMLERSA